MPKKIRVIDLFAGPGGLGEGFSAFRDKRNGKSFQLEMSVEKEASAHKTLELRALFRQFKRVPSAYYDYVRGKLTREELFSRFPKKAEMAIAETLGGPRELGPGANDDALIHSRLSELKKQHTDNWLVIGGPPCQAYSLVGRARNVGIRDYRAEDDGRYFLYEEYLKVLSTIRPKVFVMENVKGILSSKINDEFVFPKILDDLRCPDKALGKESSKNSIYRIYSMVSGIELTEITGSGPDCIIRTEQFGVPQARHRVILLGIREDIQTEPSTLVRAQGETTVGQMISELPRLRSGLSKEEDTHENWAEAVAATSRVVSKELDKRGMSASDASDAVSKAARLKSRGARFVPSKSHYRGPAHLAEWIPDHRMKGFANHDTRGHMRSDLARYLYSSCFASRNNGESPKSKDYPMALAPIHKNWKTGKFADRFKVQAKNKVSSTVTSHISKDGHAFIHFDPSQCRSLTVREAARLQTFPDNYFFEGTRTEQYVQVGNAVPPWLAYQIAAVVYELFN